MFGSRLDTEQTFGQDGPMARTRVRRRPLVALSLSVALGAILSGPVANAVDPARAPEAAASRLYVIRPGDTLWSIAERSMPSVDPRLVVDAIAAANDVDPGALVPGRQLTIPPVE